MLASVLIVALQLPLARFARRVGAVRILPVGFYSSPPPLQAWQCLRRRHRLRGWLRLLPSVCFVTLLTLGRMLLVPSAKDTVPRFAEESTLGRTTAHSPPPEALRYWPEICCLAACWIARWCPQRRRCSTAAAGPLPALQRAGP